MSQYSVADESGVERTHRLTTSRPALCRLARLVSLITVVVLPGITAAQDLSGQSVKVGEADAYPSARISYLSTNNAFLTPANEVDATGVRVEPEINLVADRGVTRIVASYSADIASWSEGALDYDDHRIGIVASTEITARNRLKGSIFVSKDHYPLGTNQTRGLGDQVDEPEAWIDTGFDVAYTYGVVDAKGNLTAGLRFLKRSYQSLDALTAGDDYTQVVPYGQFSYRLSPDARALTELRLANYDYEGGNNDRVDTSLLFGLELNRSAKTGGTILLGLTNASYDSSARDDRNLLAAEAEIFYEPTSYSRLSLSLARSLDNSDTGSSAEQAIRDEIELGWAHDWSSRVRSNAFAALIRVDRECPNAATRSQRAGFDVRVSVRRWIEVGAGIQLGTRGYDECGAVNAPDLDFEQQTATVFSRFRL